MMSHPIHSNDRDGSPPAGRAALCLTAVLLLAFVVRVTFARLVISQHTAASFASIHGDSETYVRLGDRLYDRLSYTATSGFWRSRGLVRPPGYPALYAAARAVYARVGIDLSADARPIVWPQVVISLGQVAATFGLARVVLRHLGAATFAGTLAACSPTGAAAATLLMADSPYAACFALAFLGIALTVFGKGSATTASLAGGALALAALCKPAAIYLPLLVVPAIVLARGGWLPSLVDLRRLLLPLLIVIVTWTAFNGWREGVAVYSTVSARNLRYYVVPKVELAAKLGHLPSDAEYLPHAREVMLLDKAESRVEGVALKTIYEQMIAATREAFIAHPVVAIRVLTANMGSAIAGRYKLMKRQLPDGRGAVSHWIRQFVDGTDAVPALVAWYAPMIVSPWFYRRDRRALAALALCASGVVYVALPTASIGSEGSRLILAAEPMSVTLIAASALGFARDLTRAAGGLARARSRPTSTLASASVDAASSAMPVGTCDNFCAPASPARRRMTGSAFESTRHNADRG